MIPYKSKSGKPSGVTGYEIGDDYIIVEFPKNTYKYTLSSCGLEHLRKMKFHAVGQIGLSTYIAQEDPQHSDKY